MTLREFLSTVALVLTALTATHSDAQIPLTPSASQSYPGYGPANINDGNSGTFWTSGTLAPASIDLWFNTNGTQYTISALQAQIATSPAGAHDAVIYGRKPDGGWTIVGFLGYGNYAFDGMWYYFNTNDPTPYVGLTLYTDQDPGWVAWREAMVYGTAYVPPQQEAPAGILPPRNPGDVVARDLAVTGLGNFGHVGLFDGRKVLQAMGGDTTVIQAVDYYNFWTKDPVNWPTVFTNIPSHTVTSCYGASCAIIDPPYGQSDLSTFYANVAIAQRARQIYLIGADYTLTAFVRVAQPTYMDDRRSMLGQPAVRGMYRCDTYLMDAFVVSDDQIGYEFDQLTGQYALFTRVTSGESADWHLKINMMVNVTPWYPNTFYSKVRGF